jgi:hypothetical protein
MHYVDMLRLLFGVSGIAEDKCSVLLLTVVNVFRTTCTLLSTVAIATFDCNASVDAT